MVSIDVITILSDIFLAGCCGLAIYLYERKNFDSRQVRIRLLAVFLGLSVVFDTIAVVEPHELWDVMLKKYLVLAGISLALYAARTHYNKHGNRDASPAPR